jgi:hypothetical protein
MGPNPKGESEMIDALVTPNGIWERLWPQAHEDHLGLLIGFLDINDPDDARSQLNKNYAHGGGFSPFGEGQWNFYPDKMTLQYPEDPPMRALWRFALRDEEVLVFEHALVMVRKADGSFLVTRMD